MLLIIVLSVSGLNLKQWNTQHKIKCLTSQWTYISVSKNGNTVWREEPLAKRSIAVSKYSYHFFWRFLRRFRRMS